MVCVGGFHAVCGANLLLAQTLRSRDPTWPVLGNYRPTFPGLARGRAQGSVSPSSKLGAAPEAPAGSGQVRPGPQLFLNTLSGHEGVRQTGTGLGVRGAKGPSGSGPGGSCREPLPASQSNGPGLGRGERGAGGYLVRGPGLPVPAFPRLRSTRPTVSVVEMGAWPPVRDVGVAFGRGQTWAQAWLCRGEGQVRHRSSPALPGPGPPHLRLWTLSPHPRWPWGPPHPPSTGGWPQ